MTLLVTAGLAVSCGNSMKTLTLADMPAVDLGRVMTDIRRLSSSEFEGRAPGSNGERLTVNYLVERFREAGAEPGNPDGTWVQRVPLVGITPKNFTALTVSRGGAQQSFHMRTDVMAFSQRVTDSIDLSGSEIVFAGYGVQAPEYQWDDFGGLDVRGKTIIVLVNDPPVPDPSDPTKLDSKTFGGNAMTYYGRWTYKYDKAAELGAAAVFVVHETGPAGYGWGVVQGFGGERFDLVTPDRNMGKSAVQGWLSLEAATRLLRMAGQDFSTLKVAARTRGFKAVNLGLTASMAFKQTLRTVDSSNVVARIPGSDPVLKNETVVYTSHWDHLGIGEPVNGDPVYHGARDNASGVAMLLEFARMFRTIAPAPKRSVILLAVTGEEQGLLGSAYYAQFPLYPLKSTLCAINMDELNVWGRTRDLTVIGLGLSQLDDYAVAAAAEQHRVVHPDAEPEKGMYYRSDHFNFAKAGVPALNPDSGVDFIDKPAGYGQQKRTEWIETLYHQPGDVVQDWWDLSGAAEDGRLLFAVGYRIANASAYPEWSASSEFKAVRDASRGR